MPKKQKQPLTKAQLLQVVGGYPTRNTYGPPKPPARQSKPKLPATRETSPAQTPTKG